ncbi:MAG: AcvB/VirJ family lysyl-phosphatidylglycerol hydrolase [Pseudomonadota bacterium]
MHLQTNKKFIVIILISGMVGIFATLIAIKLALGGNTKQSNREKIISEPILVNGYAFNSFHGQSPEKGLLIYISDANSPAIAASYALKFAELNYYVAAIASQTLLTAMTNTTNCLDLAETLQSISNDLQKSLKIDGDELPILVGDHEGAAIVYAALTQTNKHYFHAGISINFTPHIMTDVPLCSQNTVKDTTNQIALTQLSPQEHLSTNWYIFQSAANAEDTATTDFIDQVNNAKLTIAKNNANPAHADNDPIIQAAQILQWLDPRLSDQVTSSNTLSNLPIIEVPTEVDPPKMLAVLITGDGGWAEIDKQIAKILAEKGIPTVALDSLSYFWRARTPEETAQHIDDVINQYREKWKTQKVILIGYSFGADVLPFIANKLSDHNKTDIALVALLAMGKTAAFEFRLSSWLNADTSPNRLPILPELKSMQWANSICIYGLDDKETGCTQTTDVGVKIMSMAGDHHFNKNYELLVQHIIDSIK